MNTSTVTLVQHLLMMQSSIEEISDKNERMYALAHVIVNELRTMTEQDENINPSTFRLAEVLENMLSEIYSQNQIEQRLSELLAVYDPPDKKSAA